MNPQRKQHRNVRTCIAIALFVGTLTTGSVCASHLVVGTKSTKPSHFEIKLEEETASTSTISIVNRTNAWYGGSLEYPDKKSGYCIILSNFAE